MKQIKIFSARKETYIDDGPVTLDCDIWMYLEWFHLPSFAVCGPNYACADKSLIKALKRWIMEMEFDQIKYMRRWKRMMYEKQLKDDEERTRKE